MASLTCRLFFFHVWLRGTLDLSHFRDEQDWDGSTVIRGLGTINSIQLVLISTMDRKRKKTTTSQGPPTMKWITHEWKLIKSSSFKCREYQIKAPEDIWLEWVIPLFKRHEISIGFKSDHDNRLAAIWWYSVLHTPLTSVCCEIFSFIFNHRLWMGNSCCTKQHWLTVDWSKHLTDCGDLRFCVRRGSDECHIQESYLMIT